MSQTTLGAVETTSLAGAAAPETLVEFAGVRTARSYGSSAEELDALVHGAAVFDLGWLRRIQMAGEDRVRWLNGMVTNSIRDLAPGRSCYTFLLNAQGRIQGDGDVYALPDSLLFVTDAAQAPKIMEHLDRFIIMDDVLLSEEAGLTAMGIAGPRAEALLRELHLTESLPGPGEFIADGGQILAQPFRQSFVLWTGSDQAEQLWQQIRAAGAVPCGIEAVEAARILAGVPRYGADVHDRTLPQETGALHALNFNKGCYLGQEIVERVRSRGAVHRGIRVFALDGTAPPPGTPLFAPGKPEPVGELTSIAAVTLPELPQTHALGLLRIEAAEADLHYEGGVARALAHAPLPRL